MSLRFKSFDPKNELAAQRDLFQICFPETKGLPTETKAHYDWKFHSFPNTPHSYEYGAYEEHDLIGYYAAIPYEYFIDDEKKRCAMVCDVMTHTKARGKGIFTKIGAHSLQAMTEAGMDFTTGYPIRPEVIPGHLKVGWKIAFQLPMYLRPLKSNALLRLKGLRWLSPFVNLALSVYNFFAATKVATGDYKTSALSPEQFFALPGYDEFFAEWRAGKKNVLNKSKEFLKWRTGAPGTDYRFIVVEHQNKLALVSLIRSTELKGVPSLAVLDLMSIKKEALPLWNKAAQNLARQQGAEVIVLMASRFWAKAHKMLRLGFLPTNAIFSLIVRVLNPNLSEASLVPESHWSLMWIDSDDL